MYPQPLRELLEFNKETHQLDSDDITAFHEIQRERIDNREPIAQSFDDLVNWLETGDIILFQGSGVFSNIISTFTGRWTHSALVVVRMTNLRMVGGGVIQGKNILLVESVSHADHNVDVNTDTYKGGVRMVDLKKRLIHSDSPYFGVVKLKMSVKRKAHYARAFESFYEKEAWKNYEPNPVNLVRVAFDCGALGHNDRDTSSYFCSKLVCEALEHMGIVSKTVNSARTAPTDFWDYRLKLEDGCSVQALIFVPRIQDEEPPKDPTDEDESIETIPRRQRPDQVYHEKARLLVPLSSPESDRFRPPKQHKPKSHASKKKKPPAVGVSVENVSKFH